MTKDIIAEIEKEAPKELLPVGRVTSILSRHAERIDVGARFILRWKSRYLQLSLPHTSTMRLREDETNCNNYFHSEQPKIRS